MKSITRQITVLFLLLSFFSGCSKNNDTQIQSYLKGKVDGVVFECTSNITANTPEPISGPPDPTIRITGNWLNNSIKLMLISESSSIATTTYTFQADKNRSATIYIGSEAYYAGPSGLFLPPNLHGSGSVIITEVNKKYVKGTFSFTSEMNPGTGLTKGITDGEFYIKRN
jgi:hypothetical protein